MVFPVQLDQNSLDRHILSRFTGPYKTVNFGESFWNCVKKSPQRIKKFAKNTRTSKIYFSDVNVRLECEANMSQWAL